MSRLLNHIETACPLRYYCCRYLSGCLDSFFKWLTKPWRPVSHQDTVSPPQAPPLHILAVPQQPEAGFRIYVAVCIFYKTHFLGTGFEPASDGVLSVALPLSDPKEDCCMCLYTQSTLSPGFPANPPAQNQRCHWAKVIAAGAFMVSWYSRK